MNYDHFDYILKRYACSMELDDYGNAYCYGDLPHTLLEMLDIDFFTRSSSSGIIQLEDFTYFFPKEVYEKYARIDLSVLELCKLLPRRPYYHMRGKPISKEQAFDIIRRTDKFFHYECKTITKHPDWIWSIDFDNWVLVENHYPRSMGWVHTDGTIGVNSITQKYPEIESMLIEWFMYLLNFPYLDLIIALTDCEETLEYYTETFEELVHFGIYVHDNKIELLNQEDTLRVYEKYNTLYGQPPEKFESDYYEKNGIMQGDEQYVRKCIEAYGLNADEELLKPYGYTIKNNKQ